MQLIDWLSSHVKTEDINKEKFGLELKTENEIKEWGNDMENRFKKTGGDLSDKALELAEKRTGVPKQYINSRVLCESITYFIEIDSQDKADTLFAKAIGNGCAEAIFLLSLYHTQSGGNISDSLQFYQEISMLPPTIQLINGHNGTIENSKVSESMYMAGSFNFNGVGCDQNLEKALEYYNKGAELDNASCLRDLGLIYLEGIPGGKLEKDIEKALDYLKRASSLNDPVSLYNYGNLIFPTQPIEAFKLIQDAANLGVEEARDKLIHIKPLVEKILYQSNELIDKQIEDIENSNKLNVTTTAPTLPISNINNNTTATKTTKTNKKKKPTTATNTTTATITTTTTDNNNNSNKIKEIVEPITTTTATTKTTPTTITTPKIERFVGDDSDLVD